MELKAELTDLVASSFTADHEQALVGAFDLERKADCDHHRRAAAYGAAFGVWGRAGTCPFRGDA